MAEIMSNRIEGFGFVGVGIIHTVILEYFYSINLVLHDAKIWPLGDFLRFHSLQESH